MITVIPPNVFYFVEGRLWPVALPLGKFIDLANKSKNVA